MCNEFKTFPLLLSGILDFPVKYIEVLILIKIIWLMQQENFGLSSLLLGCIYLLKWVPVFYNMCDSIQVQWKEDAKHFLP